jgi:hypothetical protein
VENYHLRTAEILFKDSPDRLISLFNTAQLQQLQELGFSNDHLSDLLNNDTLTIAITEGLLSPTRFIDICLEKHLKPGKPLPLLMSSDTGMYALTHQLMSFEEARTLAFIPLNTWLNPSSSQMLGDLQKRRQLLANPESWVLHRASSQEEFTQKFNSLYYRFAALVLDGISLATAESVAKAKFEAEEGFQRPQFNIDRNIDAIFETATSVINELNNTYSIKLRLSSRFLQSTTVEALLLDNKLNINELLLVLAKQQSQLTNPSVRSTCQHLMNLLDSRQGCRLLTSGCFTFSELVNMLTTDPDKLEGLLSADLISKMPLYKMFIYITSPENLTQTDASSLAELQQRVKTLPLVSLRALLSGSATLKEAELAATNYNALNDIEKAVLSNLENSASLKILLSANPVTSLAALELKNLTVELKESQHEAKETKDKETKDKEPKL